VTKLIAQQQKRDGDSSSAATRDTHCFSNKAGRDNANKDVGRSVRAVFLLLEALTVEEVASAYNAKSMEVFREEHPPGTISLTKDASSLNAFCPSWSAWKKNTT